MTAMSGRRIYQGRTVFGERIAIGFQHVLALSYKGGWLDQGADARPRDRFERVHVGALTVRLPAEIRDLARYPNGYMVDALNALQEDILAAGDTATRWRDNRTGVTYPLIRSKENADLFSLARDMIDEYHRDIVATLHDFGPDMALLQIAEILRANRLEYVRHPTWGGFTIHALDAEPLPPEFPQWLVTEEIKRQRGVFEFYAGRPLTDAEANTIVRESAEERLRHKQSRLLANYGIDLARAESLKRSDRRRRATQEYKNDHTRIAPSFRDLVWAAIVTNPDAGTNAIATVINKRRADVIAELNAMEAEGKIHRNSVGQKHQWRAGAGIRVTPGPRVRVAEADALELSRDDAPETTSRRKRRAGPQPR